MAIRGGARAALARAYHATWGKYVFAGTYDRVLGKVERAGFAAQRREALADATARTLELGAGTGLNLAHYPPTVTELVLSEPYPHMVTELRRRVSGLPEGRRVTLVAAAGERLPFRDGTFDTVVGTLLLCSVPDPGALLAEVVRVLRPGGRYLFVEHVRSTDPRLGRRQDLLHWPWYAVGHGCHCNRRTAEILHASPLVVDRIVHSSIDAAPAFLAPLILGRAHAPGGAAAPGSR